MALERFMIIFRSDREVDVADVHASSPLEAVCIAKVEQPPPEGWRSVEVRRWPSNLRDVEDAHRRLA